MATLTELSDAVKAQAAGLSLSPVQVYFTDAVAPSYTDAPWVRITVNGDGVGDRLAGDTDYQELAIITITVQAAKNNRAARLAIVEEVRQLFNRPPLPGVTFEFPSVTETNGPEPETWAQSIITIGASFWPMAA